MRGDGNETNEWSAIGPILLGLFAILLLFLLFGLWSIHATLTDTIVASGRIEIDSDQQIVQHPAGGVLAEVFVREGDLVASGEPLVRLDGSRHEAKLAIVRRRLDEIHARKARLIAERDGLSEIPFPPAVLGRIDTDTYLKNLLSDEEALFRARTAMTEQELSLVAERRTQIDARLQGVRTQLAELQRQLSAVDGSLADQRSLWDRGLALKTQILALEREQSILRGQIAQSQAEIALLETEIASSLIAALQIRAGFQEDAASKIRDLEYAEIDLAERETDLTSEISGLDIRAPVGGVVSDFQAAAPLTVLQPAQPILHIVRQDRPYVVKATVRAEDYGEIYLGQSVDLRLGRRLQEKAVGVVSRMSPTMQIDPKDGRLTFDVEVTPDLAHQSAFLEQSLIPGMPVQILVNAGQRTALAYLLAPLLPIFDRIVGN